MKRIYILGVPIDDVTENEAVKYIDTLMNDGQLHQVVTVNPEFVMEAQRDQRFMQVLNDASLATADGMGILMAARWLGTYEQFWAESFDRLDALLLTLPPHGEP